MELPHDPLGKNLHAALVDPENDASLPNHPAQGTNPSGSGTRKTGPPLSALAILKKEAGVDISSLSVDEICRRLYSGFLLHDMEKKTAAQKFWVAKELDKNCFLVLSKTMEIAWSKATNYWEFVDEKEECFEGEVGILAAKLKKVCWLHVRGKFRTMVLSPSTKYEVAFVVKMSKESSGWDDPVTVNLYLPGESMQGRKESLQDKPKEKWFQIPIGSFTTSPKNVGELRFELMETTQYWKGGLVIKGVVLQALD